MLFAFEKALDCGLEDPVRLTVCNLVTRIRGGMPPEEAMDLMLKELPHEQFCDLIIAIRFNFKYRGDLPVMLEQMEIHLHRIEEEYERRSLSNARDCRLTLLIFLAVPFSFTIRMLLSPMVLSVFIATPPGHFAGIASFALYLFAIAVFIMIRRKITG